MFFVSINLIKPIELSCFQNKKELKIKKETFSCAIDKKTYCKTLTKVVKVQNLIKTIQLSWFFLFKMEPQIDGTSFLAIDQ